MRELQSARGRRGFTLTEIAIVLGIIGLILGAIWVAAAKVYSNYRVNKAMTEIMAVASKVRQLYPSGQVSGMAEITSALVAMEAYPSDMLQATCPAGGAYTGLNAMPTPCPVDPWNGGAVQVGTNITISGAPGGTNTFVIAFWNQNMKECVPLMQAIIGAAKVMNVDWLYANGVGSIANPAGAKLSDVVRCTGQVVIEFKL